MRGALALFLVLASAAPAAAQSAAPLEIQRAGAVPSAKGPAETFTGSVRIDTPFQGRAPSRISGSAVTFEPGARTAWHTHPLGQTLLVTNGCGLVQAEGGTVQSIKPGDVIWTPPGVRHWHGATALTPMTHVAIVESADGNRANWMEHVTDAQYGAGAARPPCAS